ncbi:protein takeout-like [Galleria mellonella]|uniref:Protein takeout-like n=1 Tax=Galleria mellonella TaxID=7137 RepID=A0ABM3MW99_GALME|nr:protein takeout-like [Galleria mellonella]
MLCCIIYLFTLIISATCSLVPFITPCRNGNHTCTLASARAALPYIAAGQPELDLKPLDPLHIPIINITQGPLQLTLTDNVITGLKDCKINDIRLDTTKLEQLIVILCTTEETGNYKASGQLVLLPVEGEGKYNIKTRDMIFKVTTEITTVPGDDGKLHWHVNKWKHTYQVKTGAHFQFDNLFNGNEVLAEPIHTFLNTNWKDVMEELAPPVIHSILEAIVNSIKAFLKAVPIDELVLS